MSDIRAQLRAFLEQYFDNYQLADQEDIFATGYVTSMFAIQLVTFIESRFSIEIDSDDLKLDNFRTIDAMQTLITRKTGAANPS